MKLLNQSFTSKVSLSFKHAFKEKKNRLKELIRLTCLWRYRLSALVHNKFNGVKFYYFGLKSHQNTAIFMLGLDSQQASLGRAKQSVYVSEIPLPGSICIPLNLTSLIPLKNKSMDEVLLGFEKRKRKIANKGISDFTLKQVTDVNDVNRLNQEMLMPYAARHGEAAYQLPLRQVMEMAFKYGRLHLLLEKGVEVGCAIGYEYICKNERYWISYREGFPNSIFSDRPSHTEKQVINTYVEVEWALNSGYSYFDIGFNPACAEVGSLHYKRTFGAELSVISNYNYLYLRMPKTMAAKFYWEKPLFAVEGKAVVLHLGLPDGVSADEVAERYKLLNYGGLNKVYLHCDSTPSSAHTEAVTNVYSYQKSPPALKVCVLTLAISLSARYAFITQGLLLDTLYI
jgi:hypothetical protein